MGSSGSVAMQVESCGVSITGCMVVVRGRDHYSHNGVCQADTLFSLAPTCWSMHIPTGTRLTLCYSIIPPCRVAAQLWMWPELVDIQQLWTCSSSI